MSPGPAIALVLLGCGQDPGDAGAAPAVRDGTVSGTVTDPDGAPVAGAHVLLAPRGYEALTDADGAWALDRILPGTVTVVAAAPGFETATSDPVTVSAGAERIVDLALAPSGPVSSVLTVHVDGPGELPVAGAEVRAAGRSAVTDTDGDATIEGLTGAVDVQVDADGLWTRTVPGVELADGGGAQVALALSARVPAGSTVVGSFLCAYCHGDEATRHAATPHGRAASFTAPEATQAFAEGWTVDLGQGAVATLLPSGDVQLAGSDGELRVLPVAGWIGDPARTSVPWTEEDGRAWPLPVVWVADDPARDALPEARARVVAFQAERWVDGRGRLLTPTPAQGAEARCLPCHVTGTLATSEPDGGVTLVATSPYGDDPRFVELEVGCEACHGPGSGHVAASLDHKLDTIVRPDRLDADRQADLCGSCHGAVTAHDGLPFVAFAPGDALSDVATLEPDLWPSGAARAPGEQLDEWRESAHGDDPLLGAGCTDCHDPHGGLRNGDDHDALCAGCHAGEDHAGHAVSSPSCTGCHMPRTATRSDFGAETGAGRLASHRFTATLPADALAAFDEAGVDVLAPGLFPADPCNDCHAVGTATSGPIASGPSGDPSLRSTHATLQADAARMFP